jgi:hypothetical protein
VLVAIGLVMLGHRILVWGGKGPIAPISLSALLAHFAMLQAQLDTGTITVVVKDVSGSVVPGANVVLGNENTGIDVRTLAPGTEVSMDTVNSHYRFVILDESQRKALVRGGRYFDGEAEARIEGSTLGDTLLWVGWIAEGLCLELSVQGKRVGTSRVRSIAITTAPRPA